VARAAAGGAGIASLTAVVQCGFAPARDIAVDEDLRTGCSHGARPFRTRSARAGGGGGRPGYRRDTGRLGYFGSPARIAGPFFSLTLFQQENPREDSGQPERPDAHPGSAQLAFSYPSCGARPADTSSFCGVSCCRPGCWPAWPRWRGRGLGSSRPARLRTWRRWPPTSLTGGARGALHLAFVAPRGHHLRGREVGRHAAGRARCRLRAARRCREPVRNAGPAAPQQLPACRPGLCRSPRVRPALRRPLRVVAASRCR